MIAIVGGGMSGLAAAFELNARRVPFVLFEATDRLGGLVHTEHVDGFTIEAGADSLLAQKAGGLDLCRTLGLEDRSIATQPPRTAFVLHRGRLHPLPSPGIFGIPATWRGVTRYSLLTPAQRLRMGLEALLPARQQDEESVAAFFSRRFGPATVAAIAQPLIGGIHAGDVARLSLSAVAGRLHQAEAEGSVLRWVQRTAPRADPAGGFRSFRTGMHELVGAIRERLPPESLRLSERVNAIERTASGWLVRADRGTLPASAIVLACPASTVARLVEPEDERLAATCAAIRYASTVSVALGWPRANVAHPLRGSGFVVARETNRLRITACTWVSSKWEGRAPAGQVLLRAYLGGVRDPGAIDLSDAEILAVATRELSGILGLTGTPTLGRVYRWRHAGAQHEVGHLERIRDIERRLTALPGLFVTGSGFRATGVPDCVADGRAVAREAETFLNAT